MKPVTPIATEGGPFRRRLAIIKNVIVLSVHLFGRTVGAKYRKSFLGYFWMIVPALLISGAVGMARGAGVLNSAPTDLPFILSVLIGVVIWITFAEVLNVPYAAFQGASSYLTRVMFSREAIILAQLYEPLISAAVRLLLILLLLAIFHELTLGGIAWVTIAMLATILCGVGLGALLAPFMVLISDLQNTVQLITAYGLFLTPALYQPAEDSFFATIIYSNPLSIMMSVAREGATYGTVQEPANFLIMATIGIIFTFLGFSFFRIAAPIVIERMLLGGK